LPARSSQRAPVSHNTTEHRKSRDREKEATGKERGNTRENVALSTRPTSEFSLVF